jgi:transcriptional regulator with XRE-family HTH domain
MSQQPITLNRLEFDLSDRLRKSLHVAGLSNQDMADYLGVSKNTVSRWITGAIDPKISMVRLWALRTGVPFEWLATGVATDNGGPDGPITLRLSEHPSALRIRSHFIRHRVTQHARAVS